VIELDLADCLGPGYDKGLRCDYLSGDRFIIEYYRIECVFII
jgi:hypothetical protein